LDHIGDFEKLFIKCWFSSEKKRPLVFVPAAIVALLHERVGTYPGALAEGGVNFWQAFQLIPVAKCFDFADLVFDVWPARHHGFESAYSLSLEDAFFYSGDTRPVPEILEHRISAESMIFHDCSLVGNPSHTGIDDLNREYSQSVRERIHIYHYNNSDQKQAFLDAGYPCVSQGQCFQFD
jgi:ribonuclease BN (tRNA processing enzyme)